MMQTKYGLVTTVCQQENGKIKKNEKKWNSLLLMTIGTLQRRGLYSYTLGEHFLQSLSILFLVGVWPPTWYKFLQDHIYPTP